MEVFWKAAGAVLMGLVLGLSLEKQGKEFGILLTLALCCGLGIGFFTLLERVIGFLYELQSITQLEGDTLKLLLKLVGIALVSEVTALVCADGGFGALGKGVQLLASGMILYLSVPIFRMVLELLRELLGGI